MTKSSLLLTATFATGAAGCPASLDGRCDEGACLDRNLDAATPAIEVPPGCTLGQGPQASPACVDDRVAIFVSAEKGDDGAKGTIDAPVRTISAAVSLATASRKPHIYVCRGAYTASADVRTPIHFFGGLACDFKTVSERPKWTAASPAFALKIAGVNAPVVVQDFEIAAADAQEDGESSIGLVIADSTAVRLAHVDVTAGSGRSGKSFLTKLKATQASRGVYGVDGDDGTGGAGGRNTCYDHAATGGDGANARGASQPTAGLPAAGATGAAGKNFQACDGAGHGGNGADGRGGADAPKVASLGVLTSAGWTPSSGASGTSGTSAQGGGGGGALNGSGGGGGAGGCGGEGGSGGDGGGASVALIVVQSTISLDTCMLQSQAAGNGGTAAAGQIGQDGGRGGSGGSPSPTTTGDDGCDGGTGGNGGSGGAGAGGAAGIAPGLLSKGSKIDKSATTIARGTYGQPGRGGKPGVNDGPAPTAEQASADELQLP